MGEFSQSTTLPPRGEKKQEGKNMQIIKIKKIKNKKEKENLSPYTLMYLNLKVRIGGLLIILVAHIYNEVIDILWHLTNITLWVTTCKTKKL